MDYPYLGQKIIDEKTVVVMFTSENEGTVILNETDKEKYKFGLHDEFMEEEFDFFPIEKVVRINN
jgi:hypothetical protein